jgi:uncharacterized cupredoxin-like copper-binding protein
VFRSGNCGALMADVRVQVYITFGVGQTFVRIGTKSIDLHRDACQPANRETNLKGARMRKWLQFSLIAASLLLMLTACGGGAAAPSTKIDVTLTDFQFSPNSFSVPAGAQITFTAVNNGGVEHSFVIMKLGHEIKDHFTDADMANAYWMKLGIQPGDNITDTFTAPTDPGVYQIVCHMPGHFEAGMIGTLTVVKP